MLKLEQVLSFCDFSISHCVASEASLFCLYADICHWFGRGAFEIAVAICCNPHD